MTARAVHHPTPPNTATNAITRKATRIRYSSCCSVGHAKPRRRSMTYSHSIVPGGFDVMSYTTRLIPRTSLTILLEIVRSTS